ncbi:hypothetical protein [Aeromicrobium ginsengisoli]|uniref:Lipoprotein n=1 Tax=Aeromicrobium ginsengisoli TaxID=363867 RepID=A0A5M4FFC2_9ACTN|nr:hypothetical protein [Aeromicrobium ginsengisoli]KAA1398057.1 hypothetical protein ESP70_012060 [Aeromicrobium ginsengisoli]
MGGSSRRARCAVLAVLGLLLTTACTVSFGGDKDPSTAPQATAPTDAKGVEVWDLRTPPSAADVGMRADKDHVAYETRKPRRVRFLLPQGKVLETDIYLLVFERIMHEDPADPTRPTGMDFDTKAMPLDTAYSVMHDGLTSLGLSTSPVDEWRAKIEGRPSSGPSADLTIEGGGNTVLGYLDIGVGGIYQPLDGDDSVTIQYHVNLYGH